MPALLSRQNRMNSEINVGTNAAKTTTYSMGVGDGEIFASTRAGQWTLTLPPVAEAKGIPYLIRLVEGSIAGTAPAALTIIDREDSVQWVGNVQLLRPGQSVLFRSDGERWVREGAHLGVPVAFNRYFYEQWTRPFILGTIAGGAPSTTLENVMILASGNWMSYHPKVAQTLHPVWNNPGCDWAGDQVSGDGWELTCGLGDRNAVKCVVGSDGAYFVRARFSIADVTGLADCAVGFRKREAYQADMDNYDELACLNVKAGLINIETILNNAANVVTDTTNVWADTETHTLEVRVSSAGVVTYLIDDVAPVVTAAYSFTAGEQIIPFFYMIQAADLSGAVVMTEFEAGPQPF